MLSQVNWLRQTDREATISLHWFRHWFCCSDFVTTWGFEQDGSGDIKNIFRIALFSQSALFAVSCLRSRISWRDRPDAKQLTPRILTPRTSWRQGHLDARDILTLGTYLRQKLETFALCFFSFFSPFRATNFFSKRLTFGYCDVSIINSVNCKLYRNLYFAETTQKRVVFSLK